MADGRRLLAALGLAVLAAGLADDVLAQGVDVPPQIAPRFLQSEMRGIVRFRGLTDPIGGCSAVLIAPQWALTAAHCTANGPLPQMEAARGVIVAPDAPPPVYRMPAAVALHHPGYRRDGQGNAERLATDIALVRLGGPVPPEIATPVPLLAPDTPPDARHVILGYRNAAEGPLHAQEGCRVGLLEAGLLGSDCALAPGFSGGALLRETSAGLALVGIAVAVSPDPDGPVRSYIAPVGPGIWSELDALMAGPDPVVRVVDP